MGGMEAELGGSFCQCCGDAGGASALILCENSHLGCMAGQHTYCFVPVRREISEDWYCDMCVAHRASQAAAKAKAEAAAAAAAAAAEPVLPQPPPAKRQRVADKGSQAAAPAGPSAANPAAAGAPSRAPIVAAGKRTLSLVLDSIEEDTGRRANIDGRYRPQSSGRDWFTSLSGQQYTLQSVVKAGAIWSGGLTLPMNMEESSQVATACYPMPNNPYSRLAASNLPATLANVSFVKVEEQGLSPEQVFRSASLVLAYGGGDDGQGTANWCWLWSSMQTQKLALRLELDKEDGMYLLLFINERAPPAAPTLATGMLLGVLAMPLVTTEVTKPPAEADKPRAAPPRGILKSGHGEVKQLLWSDLTVEAGRLAVCELGPGTHYADPQAARPAAPQAPLQRLPSSRPRALPSGQGLALEGVRISLLAYKMDAEVTQLLNDLRKLGANTFPRPLPGCEDYICIHPRRMEEGLEQMQDMEIAACLASHPAVLVYEGLEPLKDMLRRRARLSPEDHKPALLFPRGCITVVEGAAVQTLGPQVLEQMFAAVEAQSAKDPGSRWLFLITSEDMAAWEAEAAAGGDAAANLATWNASSLTQIIEEKHKSRSESRAVPALVRHSVKIAHNYRKAWRHCFMLASSKPLLECGCSQTSIHAGTLTDYLDFIATAAGI